MHDNARTKKQKQKSASQEEKELATLFKSPTMCIMELTVTFGETEFSTYIIHEHDDDADSETIDFDHDAIIEDVSQMLASKLNGLPQFDLVLLEEGDGYYDYFEDDHMDLDDYVVHVIDDPEFA